MKFNLVRLCIYVATALFITGCQKESSQPFEKEKSIASLPIEKQYAYVGEN